METLHLFIDTNVFLSFYEYSETSLDSIQELVKLVKRRKIDLWLPEQVEDEFYRNRENKLSTLMKNIASMKKAFKPSYPRICKDHDLFDEVRDSQKQYNDKITKLIDALNADISEINLRADHEIKELFKSSNRLPRTEEIVNNAVRRKHIGNPPGKKGSHGDEIIWESLLAEVPSIQKLCIISGDGDYISSLNKNEIKPFLRNEWKKRKKSEVELYRELATFLKKFYPNIKLELEQEKTRLIEYLADSNSFKTTHNMLRLLSAYQQFSSKEANELVYIFLDNRQVGWILGDSDVINFYKTLLANHYTVIDPELRDSLQDEIKSLENINTPTQDFDNTPF